MLKLFLLSLIIIFLNSCGVDTASSSQIEDDKEVSSEPIVVDTIIVNTQVGLDDLDLIYKNPIDNDSNNIDILDPNIIEDNSTIPDNGIPDNGIPDNGIPDVPNDGSISFYDTEDAIEDPFACLVGQAADGFTNNSISDTSTDNRGFMDEEDGVGISSSLPYEVDDIETKVTLFYYDLKPARTMDVISAYSADTKYRIDVDTGWADNDEKVIYVKTPKDENNLYGCYRYDLSAIDINSTLTSVKVYRKK